MRSKPLRIKRDVERVQGWRSVFLIFFLTLALTLVYTLVRYVVFKGVALSHLPLYLLNKSLALSSVVLIGSSFALGPLCRFWPQVFVPRLYMRKYFGLLGFGLAAMHALISVALLNPAYYPNFFEAAGKLTLAGELSILFGILAFFIFLIVSVTSLPSMEVHLPYAQWLFVQRLGYVAYGLTLFHVTTMGYAGWWDSSTWPGRLAPITLVSALFIVLVLLIRALVLLWPREIQQSRR